MKPWVRYTLIVVLLAAALAAGVATHRSGMIARAPVEADALSGFLATPLPDSTGKPRTLNEWRGQVLIVNFWATWCPPCREEMPLFIRTQQSRQGSGVQFVGIAIDNAADVQKFGQDLKVNYPLLIALEHGPALMEQMGNANGVLPFTLVLDRQGRVLQRHVGEVKAHELDSWIKAALATP